RLECLLSVAATASARQETEHVVEAFGYLLRGQVRHTRCRKLDGERYAVQTTADLGNRGDVRGVEVEGRLHGLRPRGEQPHRLGPLGFRAVSRRGEGRHRPRLLAFDVERLARGGQDRHVRTAREDSVDQVRAAVKQVLAVVEDEQDALWTEMIDDQLV